MGNEENSANVTSFSATTNISTTTQNISTTINITSIPSTTSNSTNSTMKPSTTMRKGKHYNKYHASVGLCLFVSLHHGFHVS